MPTTGKKVVKKGSDKKSNPKVNSHVTIEKGKGSSKEILAEKGSAMEEKDRVMPMSSLPEGKSIVGLSKGVTLSMGNYQSARVDCWVIDVCDSDATSRADKLAEISSEIDDQIVYESTQFQELLAECDENK